MPSRPPTDQMDPDTTPPGHVRNDLDTPLDQTLVERLQTGDREAFQSAVQPLLGAMLSLARRWTQDHHVAEDLLQETLTQAYSSIHTYRGEASLRTWLFRIEMRLAQRPSRWYRGDRPNAQTTRDLQIPDQLSCEPEQQTRERELAERLAEAIERLTPRQRTALHLRAVEGLDYQMIAVIMNGSVAAARMLVLAARRHVMKRMGRHLEP